MLWLRLWYRVAEILLTKSERAAKEGLDVINMAAHSSQTNILIMSIVSGERRLLHSVKVNSLLYVEVKRAGGCSVYKKLIS